MPQGYPQFHQVLLGQVGQRLEVDFLFGEKRRVSLQAVLSQPGRDRFVVWFGHRRGQATGLVRGVRFMA